MLRLTTLGALDLRDRLGRPLREVLSQPKRVALLVHLALEGRTAPVTRERLARRFWPGSDPERARNALSQALHHLRQSVGPGVLENQGAYAIRVAAEQVWCDVVEFEAAIEGGDAGLALDLYRGPFCPGLSVSGAPEVEAWLADRQRRLRALALAAARTLAGRLLERGDTHGAARAAQRALALEPEDDDDVRSLLVLLERAGDRAGALAAFDDHVRRLAAHGGAQPSPETRAVVGEIRDRHTVAASGGGAPGGAGTPPAPARTSRRRLAAAGAVAAGAALCGLLLARYVGAAGPADPRLVVVAPFSLASPDSSLRFLGLGLSDLVAGELSSAGSVRAADPRTVHGVLGGDAEHTTEREALAAARHLGAGWLVSGTIVGPRQRLTVTVRVRATNGARFAAATFVAPLDSLAALSDRIAGHTLVTVTGEPSERRRGLAGVAPAALRAYLQGRAAFRAAEYALAVRRFREAVATDSTFALAALELATAADFIGDGSAAPAMAHAWRLRERLEPADRAMLVARLGPRYPAFSTIRERFEAARHLVRQAPERPDAWYELGDNLFHVGAVLAEDSGFVRADEALARSVALDSNFAAALGHLVQIAIARGDRATVRRLHAAYARRDSASETATFLRWRVAIALGDTATVSAIEARLDSLPFGVLRRIAEWGQLDGVRGDVAFRAAVQGLRRASPADRYFAERILAAVALNAGRIGTAEEVWNAWRRDRGLTAVRFDAARVSADHFSDGDTSLARYETLIGSLTRSGGPDARTLVAEFRGVRRLLGLSPHDTLRGDAGLTGRDPMYGPLEAARRGEGAASWLAVTDSMRAAAIQAPSAGLVARIEAEALLLRGDGAGAARAAARRVYASDGTMYLAPLLRLEGRGRELAGDTAGALRAYRHYLALRFDPEPALRPYNDSVRAAVARLQRRSSP